MSAFKSVRLLAPLVLLFIVSLVVGDGLPLRLPSLSHADMPLQHIVFVMKENRTFDAYFGLFPGADGTTSGQVKTSSGVQTISLNSLPDVAANFCHEWGCAHKDYDHGY